MRVCVRMRVRMRVRVIEREREEMTRRRDRIFGLQEKKRGMTNKVCLGYVFSL